MKKAKTEIIPLGQNCIARTVLTRWKIKKRKIMGEKTYPFDLAVFGMPEITKTLKTDFSEFFDNLEYNGEYWLKSPNCIYFMHDKRYKEKDKEKLIALYQKRIDNFRKALCEAESILFVQVLGKDEDIKKQYLELKRLRENKPFKIAIIDTQNVIDKLDLENDTHKAMLNFLKSHFDCEDCEAIYNNKFLLKVINGREKVEFSEECLTEQQKQAIAFGLNTLDDFRPRGGVYGERIQEIRIIKPSLTDEYKDGGLIAFSIEELISHLITSEDDTSDIKKDEVKKEEENTQSQQNDFMGLFG